MEVDNQHPKEARERLQRVMSLDRHAADATARRHWPFSRELAAVAVLLLLVTGGVNSVSQPTAIASATESFTASASTETTDTTRVATREQLKPAGTPKASGETAQSGLLVVVFSSSEAPPALAFAEQLALRESGVRVVRANSGYYGVTLGAFDEAKAQTIRTRMVRNGIASDAYLISTARVRQWLPTNELPSDRRDSRLMASR